MSFAPERQPAGASAFAKVLKAPAYVAPERRWSVWAAGYGAQNRIDGDPIVVGSTDVRTTALGYSVGVDYRFAPGGVVGVAVAGGNTDWDLGLGLGSGSGDAIQAGAYGKYQWNAAYVAGAVAGAFHDMQTTRTVTIAGTDTLRADFDAQTYGGRLEGGYRFSFGMSGVTPYAAGQVQQFNLPAYSEVAASGVNTFALNFAANDATAARAELGARFDTRYVISPDAVATLFGRLAYAHDWTDDRSMAGLFQALPGAGFTVFGADPNTDLALAQIGAEFATRNGWSATAKIGGELGSNIQTYNALARVRYTW
jgi:outer membrane autotransporter protein